MSGVVLVGSGGCYCSNGICLYVMSIYVFSLIGGSVCVFMVL